MTLTPEQKRAGIFAEIERLRGILEERGNRQDEVEHRILDQIDQLYESTDRLTRVHDLPTPFAQWLGDQD